MSRWLWALLGGAVLVAIAAAFWIASNQTNVTSPVSPAPAPVTPAPAPAPTAQNVAPHSPPPAPAPPAPPAPTRRPMRDSKRPRRLLPHRPLRRPPLRPRRAGSFPPPAPAPLAEPPPPPPAPGREAQDVAGLYAPKSLAQLVGTWAYSPADCERLPAARRRLGLSSAGGQVRPGRDCRIAEEDRPAFRHLPHRRRIWSGRRAQGKRRMPGSISYTPRSVMIALRSATELIYSASGDPALATTLKKCPQ